MTTLRRPLPLRTHHRGKPVILPADLNSSGGAGPRSAGPILALVGDFAGASITTAAVTTAALGPRLPALTDPHRFGLAELPDPME